MNGFMIPLKKYIRMMLIAALTGVFAWMVIFGFKPMFQYGLRDMHRLQQRYGFTYSTPDYQWWPCHIELITVMKVTPGGVFDKAGFEPGDVFPAGPRGSTDDLFVQLDKPEGTVIEMEVLPGDLFEPECNFDPTGKTVIRKFRAP